jgi:tRNA G46 methylase TrmB
VAIEHTKTRFKKFEGRYKNHNLPNLLPIHADAIKWITHTLKENSVEEYFFLYPNPYPKKSDQNKRWHAMPFMKKIISTLKTNGLLTLATNEYFYATEAIDFLTNNWNLTLISNEKPMTYRTHFEKKYMQRGQECFNLVFKK